MGNQVQRQHVALNTHIIYIATTIPTPVGLPGVNPRGMLSYKSVNETWAKQWLRNTDDALTSVLFSLVETLWVKFSFYIWD